MAGQSGGTINRESKRPPRRLGAPGGRFGFRGGVVKGLRRNLFPLGVSK